jgi:hypothetical protein
MGVYRWEFTALERFCSVTLADHLGSVMHNWKHNSCVKCPNSVKCKIDISAVFVVKSDLDSFMISGVGNGWLVCGLVWVPDGIWWWVSVVWMETEAVLIKVLE